MTEQSLDLVNTLQEGISTMQNLTKRRHENYERKQEANIQKLAQYIPEKIARAIGAVFLGNIRNRRIDADTPFTVRGSSLLFNADECLLNKSIKAVQEKLKNNDTILIGDLKKIQHYSRNIQEQLQKDLGVNTNTTNALYINPQETRDF